MIDKNNVAFPLMISMSTPCLEERPRTSRSKSSTDQTGLRLLSRITSPSRSPARSADSPAPPPRPPRLFQCSADADPPALTRQIYGADLLSAAFLFDLALLGHRFCLYHVLAMLTHPVRAGFKGSDPFVSHTDIGLMREMFPASLHGLGTRGLHD